MLTNRNLIGGLTSSPGGDKAQLAYFVSLDCHSWNLQAGQQVHFSGFCYSYLSPWAPNAAFCVMALKPYLYVGVFAGISD